MTDSKQNFKVIRKIKLCNYLLNKGFNFVETRVDYKYPNRYVWIFPYNDQLRASFQLGYLLALKRKGEYIDEE